MRVASGRGGSKDDTGMPEAATVAPDAGSQAVSQRETTLLRRAPGGYLWNQAFSLWLFLSLFLHQWVITNFLPVDQRGVFEFVKTPANLAVYIAALGLESAGSVFLPRALAEGGPAHAAAVAMRLTMLRLLAVLLIAAIVLFGLPLLAGMLAAIGLPGAKGLANALSDPELLQHRVTLAGYVLAVGMTNLLAALLTALLRTRTVFIFGSVAQLFAVGLAFVFVVPLRAGPDGGMWALTIPAAFTAIVYGVMLFRALGLHAVRLGRRVMREMLALGFASWLADLVNGSLIKQVALLQLGLLLVIQVGKASLNEQAAYFGVAFEMGHAASQLFVAGLGGVGLAVMAAAYADRHKAHLATAWRTISKLQVALGVPLVAFCVPHAGAIIHTLYPDDRYAPDGYYLALFLAFNALVRLSGGGAHAAVLYVLGKSRWVVASNWLSLGVLALFDLLLIPPYGVAGGLVAVGIAQMAAELMQLALARSALRGAYPVGFMLRVMLALVPGMVFSYLWRPTSFAPLILAGLGFTALFVLGLWIIRPLDAEDSELLQQVASPLRTLLLPFVPRSKRRFGPPIPPVRYGPTR